MSKKINLEVTTEKQTKQILIEYYAEVCKMVKDMARQPRGKYKAVKKYHSIIDKYVKILDGKDGRTQTEKVCFTLPKNFGDIVSQISKSIKQK